MGLWNGKQGLGLYTHLLAVLAKLAVPSSLTLSTCRRGTVTSSTGHTMMGVCGSW